MKEYILEQLVNSDHVLVELVFTVVQLVVQMLMAGSIFYISLAVAGVLAIITGFVVRFIVVNVNLGYKTGLGFVIGCSIASLTTFVAVVLCFALQFADPVVRVAIKGWEATVYADQKWRSNTFRDAYESVSKLMDDKGKQLENFKNYPHPDKGGVTIPLSSDKATLVAIETYLDNSIKHFNKNMPFLSWILWVDSDVGKEDIYKDIKRVFATNSSYEMADAISIAGKEIAIELSSQSERIVWFGRIIIFVIFIFIEGTIIGLLVWSALRGIREKF